MARKFLYIFAGLIVLVLAGMLLLRIFADDLTTMAFVPDAEFTEQPPLADNAYSDMAMWIARPGMGAKNPAMWLPDGTAEDADASGAAVFFIHPTSYLEKAYWNAPIDEKVSRERAELFVRGMASPFNKSADIWVPRYRQAAFGAFLTDEPAARKALGLAYGDVLQAFDVFIATVSPDAPIVLAGHSQGGMHLRRLLKDRVAGTALEGRIAAAYVIGWPVSLEHDLQLMGLPACTAPDQPGCVMSWLSFAEPADTDMLLNGYWEKHGLDGASLRESPFLCTNPLTGKTGGTADASANLGTLLPGEDLKGGTMSVGTVPASCGEDGFLYIGSPPGVGPFVLPGNNYHVYDITLFWANLRADFDRRVKAWAAQR
ncbi:MAG: DUF3089 domain-containing protein [Novosphingobium sp.]|nr:DUF3089 domain-containing protein [Novosphingobium sp.]